MVEVIISPELNEVLDLRLGALDFNRPKTSLWEEIEVLVLGVPRPTGWTYSLDLLAAEFSMRTMMGIA